MRSSDLGTRKNALRTIKTLLKFVSRALSTILALRWRRDNGYFISDLGGDGGIG